MGDVIHMEIFDVIPMSEDAICSLFSDDPEGVHNFLIDAGFNNKKPIQFRCGHIIRNSPTFVDDEVDTPEEVLDLFRMRMLDGDESLQLFVCQKRKRWTN